MNWYVVYTQAQKEMLATLNLRNQGFEVYLPRYRRRRSHARRVDTVVKPLFPRYLFIRMDPSQQPWRSINGTFGISHILSEGNTPTPIDQAVIGQIRGREIDGTVVMPPPELKKGQKVCVTEGAFEGIEGIFECHDDNLRAVLLLELMGRVVRTRVPGQAVVAA